MTLFKMSLPPVEIRPPVTVEKPTSAQSIEEETDRFLAALQRAEARRPAAKPVEPEHHPAPRVQPERATPVSQQAQDLQEARQELAAARRQAESAGQESEPVIKSQDDAPVTSKSRSRKKADDGWEGGVLALPGTLSLMYATPLHCPGMEARPAGAAQLAAPVPGVVPPGQSGLVQPGLGAGQGVMPGVAAGHAGTMSPQVMPHMNEVMAVNAGIKNEGAMPVQLHGAEEKPDGSFAMRLIDNTTRNSAMETVAKAMLPAHSPTFGEDLAEQVGRMRVISRPGVSEQVRISLHPRELGALDMRLVVDEHHQVHLMITTDSDSARDALNRQMPQLREALARQNLGMGEVTVHVDDGRGGSGTAPEWGFQGENRQQELLDRSEANSWRRARPEVAVRGVESVGRSAPLAVAGGSGLSLFA